MENEQEALISYLVKHFRKGHSVYSAMLGLYHDNESVHFANETGAFTHLTGHQLKHIMQLESSDLNLMVLRALREAQPTTGRQPIAVTLVKGDDRQTYPSVRSAARALSVPASNVSRVLNGKARTVKGWQVFAGGEEA